MALSPILAEKIRLKQVREFIGWERSLVQRESSLPAERYYAVLLRQGVEVSWFGKTLLLQVSRQGKEDGDNNNSQWLDAVSLSLRGEASLYLH